jgi:hypothetical protein
MSEMLRYKFDVAADYSLSGDVGAALNVVVTSDAIDMNLESTTGVADWVGARVSFTSTPDGFTGAADVLRCAILLSGDGTNFTVPPAGVVYEGGMLPGSMGVLTDSIVVTDADDVIFPPVNIMNFYVRNRGTATPSYVAFAVQVAPSAVAMKVHLYKSADVNDTYVISGASIQRYRTAILGGY